MVNVIHIEAAICRLLPSQFANTNRFYLFIYFVSIRFVSHLRPIRNIANFLAVFSHYLFDDSLEFNALCFTGTGTHKARRQFLFSFHSTPQNAVCTRTILFLFCFVFVQYFDISQRTAHNEWILKEYAKHKHVENKKNLNNSTACACICGNNRRQCVRLVLCWTLKSVYCVRMRWTICISLFTECQPSNDCLRASMCQRWRRIQAKCVRWATIEFK